MPTSNNTFNPILFENNRTKRLCKAKNIFLNAVDRYLDNHPDMHLEVTQIKKEIEIAYVQLKSEYLLENKFSNFNNYFSKALDFAVKNKQPKKVPHSNFYYLKESKRFTFNEQH